MATKAQIAANRRNGAKSKGPRTEEGRAVASRNSLKHGLTAEEIVLIFGEAEEDFTRFHDELRNAFAPADAVEEQLVERIVLCAWRLRRAYRAETGTMNDKLAEVLEWREKKGIDNGWKPHPPIAFDGAAWRLETISRYEVTIERSLNRGLMMLERRQALRLGKRVPAPIAVHVECLDAGIETLHPAPVSLFQDHAVAPAEPSAAQPPEIA